jgi:hypothetical protein
MKTIFPLAVSGLILLTAGSVFISSLGLEVMTGNDFLLHEIVVIIINIIGIKKITVNVFE